MHSTLQRPHLHSRQPQPSTLSSLSSSSSSSGGRAAAAAAVVYRRAEDSDDIDDILGSLWPTGTATLYLHRHQPLQGSRPPSAQSHLTSSLLSSGQCTPPEDATCPRVAPATTLYSHHTTEQSDKNTHSEYTLVAPSATMSSSSAQPIAGGPASGRSVSASIQIGDPEWRVDSPQSMARPLHHLPKLPSPVSPVTPAAYHQHRPYQVVESHDTGTETRVRPLLPNLGLAMPAHRMQASARSVTLGSAGQPPPLPTRVVTPAERVARLNTVSGLAARAVARRCMSAHSSVLPAGFGCGEEATMPASCSHLATGVANCKPTFADVAKGSQEPPFTT
ncbi:hypothetical protein GGH94_001295 [Coemansia aciculifera]|uniref:Uncharacterized protein n=1 Tax=Coemansia aciculifera TaxID=417176 RepID=A0A9W8IN44_9FUNG|nr:hypothetical protein GGH94_001295 [Coemansia aciculifera]